MHISTESQEIWPPELQISILREEFHTKEQEMQNTIQNAHSKYTKLRDNHYELHLKLQELEQQLQESNDQIMYLEEKSNIDEMEINGLRDEVEEKIMMIEDLKADGWLEGGSDVDENVDVVDSNHNDREGNELKLQNKVAELEAVINELEEQNAKAKECIKDLTQMSRKKREQIQFVVMQEKVKNERIEENLKFHQHENAELLKQLDKAKEELKLAQEAIEKEKEEALQQKEEEERAKLFSKESLEIATNAVRQAEVREGELKKQLKKANKKIEDEEEKNKALLEEIEELKSSTQQLKDSLRDSIEEEMDQYDNDMKLLALENDWKFQVNDLSTKLQAAQDSRQVQVRQELRMRQVFDETVQRYKVQLETVRSNWEEKFEKQKMECSSLAHQLKTEIMTLNNSLMSQAAQIKALEQERDSLKAVEIQVKELEQVRQSLEVAEAQIKELEQARNSLKLAAVSPSNNVLKVSIGVETKESHDQNSPDVDSEKPKRFRRMRNQLRKIKNIFKRENGITEGESAEGESNTN